jgi:hypothetical protein
MESPARMAHQPGQHFGVFARDIVVVEHRMDRFAGRALALAARAVCPKLAAELLDEPSKRALAPWATGAVASSAQSVAGRARTTLRLRARQPPDPSDICK